MFYGCFTVDVELICDLQFASSVRIISKCETVNGLTRASSKQTPHGVALAASTDSPLISKYLAITPKRAIRHPPTRPGAFI